jgi:hypothetical protein
VDLPQLHRIAPEQRREPRALVVLAVARVETATTFAGAFQSGTIQLIESG